MLNALDEFRQEKGWTYSDLARELGEDPRTVRRWCLPFDHKEFSAPRFAATRKKIRALTGGRVTADSFEAAA